MRGRWVDDATTFAQLSTFTLTSVNVFQNERLREGEAMAALSAVILRAREAGTGGPIRPRDDSRESVQSRRGSPGSRCAAGG